MKIIQILSIIFLFLACSDVKVSNDETREVPTAAEIVVPAFHEILDSAKVKGAVLIYNLHENKYYSNDFQWAKKGRLPASTFKIANSIIALETGVVEDDSTLFKWDGAERSLDIWEQDLVFREAFHYSCVPCYQDVARNIGVSRMVKYLDKLGYGNMKVDSSNIDMFWLAGESRINQYEQIDFLKRFYKSELPISEKSKAIMKEMMVIEENDDYKLSGKTGWSIRNGNDNGWFVGFVETADNVYFFATNVSPEKDFDMEMFPMIRKDVTYKAFKEMNIFHLNH